MVKVLAVVLLGVLLIGGCSSVEKCSEMTITSYGEGGTKWEATKHAWQNAKDKLNISGLEGYALVEDGITLGRAGGGMVAATIRFRLMPVEAPAQKAGVEEAEGPSE